MSSEDDELQAEHEALKSQVDALQREHNKLEKRPGDIPGHREHRAKLRIKKRELQAHASRLRRQRDQGKSTRETKN